MGITIIILPTTTRRVALLPHEDLLAWQEYHPLGYQTEITSSVAEQDLHPLPLAVDQPAQKYEYFSIQYADESVYSIIKIELTRQRFCPLRLSHLSFLYL